MKDTFIKVAFLDSGHGGLDVLYHFFKSRGEQGIKDQLIYAADIAFMPYGELPSDKIFQRCSQLCHEIKNIYNPDIFVIACNTATAHAIDRLRDNFDTPFVGMEPYLNYINKFEKQTDPSELQKGHIGALVTPSTLIAPRFQSLKDKRDPLGLVDVLALPELAPLIESYIQQKDREVLVNQLGELFKPHLPRDWKEVILGCTHYPIIQNELENLLGAKCISPADRVVEQICKRLSLDTAQHQNGPIHDFSFEYQNTSLQTWRKASLSEFLPWYLI